jgi:hypothetical protein
MYEHHIKDMATSLVEAGLATDGEQVELVLGAYWADKVAFSGIIATAPSATLQSEPEQASPKLLALFDCLPEAERELLNVALTSLFIQGKGEITFLSKEQAKLAESILAADKDYV